MRKLSIQFVAISLIGVLSVAGLAQGALGWQAASKTIEQSKNSSKLMKPYIKLIETQDTFDDSRLTQSAIFFNPDKNAIMNLRAKKRDLYGKFVQNLSAADNLTDIPEIKTNINEVRSLWDQYLKEDAVNVAFNDKGDYTSAIANFNGPARDIREKITSKILDSRIILFNKMSKENLAQEEYSELSLKISIFGLLLFLLTSVFAIFYFKKFILNPLAALNNCLKELSQRNTGVVPPGLDRQDELGEMARSMDALRVVTISAFRSEAAVNDGSVPFLIADENNIITAVNRSFLTALRGRRDEIRKQISNFDPDNLIGKSMDIFHRNPDHQRRIVADMTSAQVTRVKLGEAIFDLTVWPVRGSKSERIGTVLQWEDKTDEVTAQNEIENLVSSAKQGDFSGRIPLAGKSGFFKGLADGLNAVSTNVDKGLNEANRMLAAMSRGDVGVRFEGEFEGQFRQLQTSANSTAETLAGISSRISAACDSVLSATREISVGATDLSERTEQQAASLQETAASMEELATTVRHTASNARDAAGMSSEAETSAESGGTVVSEAVSAMSRIEESAGRITEIVGLIEEIAFQTNLLALNAAVEAARAGEAGKGFAVVASEVRALAQRAGAASREIKGLIVSSNSEVRDGVSLVRQAGESLEGIVSSVRRAARVIAEISSAAGEQSAGLDEVNKAVSQLDQITQQNAALVEETTAALDATRSQVEELADLIGFFKTGYEGGHDVVPLRPRTRAANTSAPSSPARRLQETARTQVKARMGSRSNALAHEDADDWKEF